MIIGITRDMSSDKGVSEYISKNYDFKTVDGDKILEKILSEKKYSLELKNKNWKTNLELLSDIRSKVDKHIIRLLNTFDKSDNIIIDYSLLEDSICFEYCEAIINIESNNIKNNENNVKAMKKYKVDSMMNKFQDIKYNMEINYLENWKEKVKKYMDYNFLHDKKVSVIVPIYNTSNFLPRCVNSIKNQTYRNLEIILIDDGSTDNSLEICKILAKTDDRIKVVHQSNSGLAETRNNGIDISTGDYVCFIDSDDYIENGMIETLLKNVEIENVDVSGVRAYIHLRSGSVEGFSNKRTIETIKGKNNVINSYADGIISIAAWDKLYKKEALDGIRFDKNVFKEDVDFILKLCLAGRSFVCDTKEFYHYVKRDDGSITGKFSNNIFQLQEWGHNAYNNIIEQDENYKDAAEKCLFNSLSHILKTYMRDLKRNKVASDEYNDEIQSVTNDLITLLLNASNVKKFDDLDNVLDVINILQEKKVISKEKMPTLEVPCIGILWNSLNENLMKEAIEMISNKSKIINCTPIDLKDKYQDFINDIYYYNNEFEGIPYFKGCGLIDKYDTNTIVILNLIVKVSNYIYYNGLKGYMFKEIAELKQLIRKTFKTKIKNYGYDTIFHLTVDDDEYKFTDSICKKYIKVYKSI